MTTSEEEIHHKLKSRIGSLTTCFGPGSRYDEEDGQLIFKKQPYLINFTVRMSRGSFFLLFIAFLSFSTLFIVAERKVYLKTVNLTSEIEKLKSNLLPNGHLMKTRSNSDQVWESEPENIKKIEKNEKIGKIEKEEKSKVEEIPKVEENFQMEEKSKTEEKLQVEEKTKVGENLQTEEKLQLEGKLEEEQNLEEAKKVQTEKNTKSENELKEGWLDEAKKLRENFPEADRGLDPSKKYMLYSLGNDYGTGLMHYSSSLWGMMAEARKLNRVLVWEHIFLPPHHNSGESKRISPNILFDRPRIEREYQVELVDESDFWGQRKKSEKDGETISYRRIEAKTPTADIENEDAIILERDFSLRWDVFAYSLKNDYNNAWDEQVWYAPYLIQLAEKMIDELNHGDFVAVHVRRGDKAARKDKWPNLDIDTQGDQLALKLPQLVASENLVYVATDESEPGFFDPLKEIFEVKVQKDFSHMWSEGSDWWKASLEISGNSDPPEFDSYQQALVDYTLCKRAKKTIETFPDLTNDSWNP